MERRRHVRHVDRHRHHVPHCHASRHQPRRRHRRAAEQGLALPFISYGGSNLVIMLGCVGLLINIGRHANSTLPVSAPAWTWMNSPLRKILDFSFRIVMSRSMAVNRGVWSENWQTSVQSEL